MSRVAIVTGGTRGIGAAISKALKAAGYKVAASYAGNDEAAKAFQAETGINVYKWDVSDYDACVAGIAKVEADLGPIEILVNNAGITKDGMFHKMTKEQWYAVINTNLNSLFNMTRPVWEGMRARKFGRVVCISSVNGQKGQAGQANYSAASSRLLPRKAPARALPSTRFAPAISRPRWSRRSIRRSWKNRSFRISRSAVLANPRRSRASWCSLSPMRPPSSRGRPSPLTAANIWPDATSRATRASLSKK